MTRAKVILYRIQNKQGRGPFAPGLTKIWIEYRPDHKNLVPYYETWPLLKINTTFNYGCACRTVHQLKRWFTEPEYRTLKALGFDAVKIQVDRVERENDIQCVFRRKKQLYRDVVPFDLYEGE